MLAQSGHDAGHKLLPDLVGFEVNADVSPTWPVPGPERSAFAYLGTLERHMLLAKNDVFDNYISA